MHDRFSGSNASLSGPASFGFAIVPQDDDTLSEATRGLYVGQGGDLAVTTIAGADITFKAVPAGSILPVRVQKVFSTGTTAGDILGLV
ncbi:spike base protein, RCAP_Rcc01079 family [Rhizobium halophytocola]|uniref:Uncharacterized protein n=1 Tax=Rhizobium halophytocola TaxID=735519 RepID=A0ABS4DZZ8_9HYPH|nr:hypothetical protein [Rhizobium halophytocola]MBP1851261.1 hypothetical protein [Rhizobium halophytocola]